ncbi:MAG: hypothetical protein ABIY52_16715 [Gemmatimonadaceae bacterium]
MRRGPEDGGGRRGALRLARALLFLLLALVPGRRASAQDGAPLRLDAGRFTAVYFPRDEQLARSLLRSAAANDSFPWLPRPVQHVLIALAPDAQHFRAWAGPDAPEWGAALAFPESRRIVMQGRSASSDAGNPIEVLRHELAHLALHERLGNKPPRWFDEGYASLAARELSRDDVLAANLALVLRGTPSLDALEDGFHGGSVSAQAAYALSYRAVMELASFDPARGLTLFFRYWEGERTLDAAVRQAFGITLAGFEKEFQVRTRRRYGALALFADVSITGLVTLVLVFPFFLARRSRDRRRLKAMLAADEVSERLERESALAALVAGAEETPDRLSVD